MMQLRRNALLCLSWAIAFLAMLSLCPATVLAQEDDEDTFMLEDVIVTAEKRETELKDIPLAVSVVNTDDMARANVTQMRDLEKIVPELRTTENYAMNVISIRNVQSNDWAPFLETVTAVHVDHVFLPRYTGLDNFFYDLERVEVLKGPQGTLHGRSSVAGSINIISNKPVLDTFTGHAEVEYGEYDKMRFEGAVNFPIAENVALRTAWRSLREDALNENGYSTKDNRSMRGSLLWEPNDRSSLLITADYAHFDFKPVDTGIYFGTYGTLTNLTPIDSPWDSTGFYDDADAAWTRGDQWGVMAQYDHEFDFALLTAQYGHRASDSHFNQYAAGTTTVFIPPASAMFIKIPFRVSIDSKIPAKSDVLEVRLLSNTSSAGGDTWEWVVGANYLNDNGGEFVESFFVYYDILTDNNTTALFGQATWSPFDRWHFTAGYRYSWDDKNLCSSTLEDYPDADFPPTPVLCADAEYGEPSYKGVISYDINDDIMTYVQYARGQKVGNLESTREALPSEILDAYEWGLKGRFFNNRMSVNLDAFYYDYNNYNVFFSGGWCISDVNGDHFCDDANGDGTVDNSDMSPYYTGTVSAGDSQSQGVSLGLTWLVTQMGRFSANIAYQQSEYGTYNTAAAVLARHPGMDTYLQPGSGVNAGLDGQEFGDPNWRANFNYTHTFQIGETGTLDLTAEVFYEGQGIDQIQFLGEDKEYAIPGRDSFWLADFQARYSSTYGMPFGMLWHVRFWINNIFDSTDLNSIEYFSTHSGEGDVYPPMSGTISGTYVLPQQFGLAIGVNW